MPKYLLVFIAPVEELESIQLRTVGKVYPYNRSNYVPDNQRLRVFFQGPQALEEMNKRMEIKHLV